MTRYWCLRDRLFEHEKHDLESWPAGWDEVVKHADVVDLEQQLATAQARQECLEVERDGLSALFDTVNSVNKTLQAQLATALDRVRELEALVVRTEAEAQHQTDLNMQERKSVDTLTARCASLETMLRRMVYCSTHIEQPSERGMHRKTIHEAELLLHGITPTTPAGEEEG